MRAVKGLRGMAVVRRGRKWRREEGVHGKILRSMVDGGDVVVVVGGRGDGEEEDGEGYGWGLWDALW